MLDCNILSIKSINNVSNYIVISGCSAIDRLRISFRLHAMHVTDFAVRNYSHLYFNNYGRQ